MRGELPNLCEIIFYLSSQKTRVFFSVFFYKANLYPVTLTWYKSDSVSEIAYAKLSTDPYYNNAFIRKYKNHRVPKNHEVIGKSQKPIESNYGKNKIGIR